MRVFKSIIAAKLNDRSDIECKFLFISNIDMTEYVLRRKLFDPCLHCSLRNENSFKNLLSMIF